MFILRIYLIILLITPLSLFSKNTPAEGAALNYRIIGFSFSAKENTSKYIVKIAEGNLDNEKSFSKNILVTAESKTNRIVAEVPYFGKQYSWQVTYEDEHSKKTKSELFHFSTLMSPDINPDSVRMRILCDSERYKDNYIFVDCNKVLYDMKGNPVWFFPKIENRNPASIHLRDLHLSQFGTLTSIVNGRIYEINYNGDVLWQGPENSEVNLDSLTVDHGYHHEFTRLPNGNYMAMGFEQPYWQLPAPPDSAVFTYLAGKVKRDSNNNCFQKMFFSTINEYDEKGNIVWKWSDADYFKNSDLQTRMLPSKLFDVNDTHANAFYFDEKKQSLFISYREINRIIEVKYPGKDVLHTYGKSYIPGITRDRHLTNGMFCGQHSCKVSSDGYLYMFNNNVCHRGSLPTILMLKEPKPGTDTLEKLWEFECPPGENGETSRSALFSFGGNVSELPDKNLFICMGGSYGKLLIVNRDKKILWSSQPEKWDNKLNKWIKDGVTIDNKIKEGSYRASILNRQELESLIWNEPLNKQP